MYVRVCLGSVIWTPVLHYANMKLNDLKGLDLLHVNVWVLLIFVSSLEKIRESKSKTRGKHIA